MESFPILSSLDISSEEKKFVKKNFLLFFNFLSVSFEFAFSAAESSLTRNGKEEKEEVSGQEKEFHLIGDWQPWHAMGWNLSDTSRQHSKQTAEEHVEHMVIILFSFSHEVQIRDIDQPTLIVFLNFLKLSLGFLKKFNYSRA